MVQRVLKTRERSSASQTALLACLAALFFLASARGYAADKPTAPVTRPPDILLEGGRKLVYERSFRSEREVRGKPGFFAKVLNFVAGQPQHREMIRPYSIAVDSRGRAIITDPGAGGVHIFDFAQHKYKFIERSIKEKDKDPMLAPQCVAVDAHDNIYVTDSEAGKIFVFDANGKFLHALGSLKRGEGFFKRPTGIAVEPSTQSIYVTDTLRDKVYVLDQKGAVLRTVGQHGAGKGEFNFPTEVRLKEQGLLVVDAMNFRVQMLDPQGAVQGVIGQVGDTSGTMFRPKGVDTDSEGHIYVVDGLWAAVQVFDREGRLLYYFGSRGTANGQFELPTGLFIDHEDRVFVVDSYNRRVQVFRYYGLRAQAGGERR